MPISKEKRFGGYLAGAVPPSAKRAQANRFAANDLPQKVDLRKHMTSIELQIGNSCVANAFAGAFEYLAKRELGDSEDVSRMFIYYNARAELGYEDEDVGTMMHAAIEALKKYGACSESLWQNDEETLLAEPPAEAYDQAAQFTVEDAEYVELDVDLWKSMLAEGFPIAFSINTFDSFDEASRQKGRVPMPKRSDNVRDTHGWHAMLCVGYSEPDQMFIVRNSWGDDWGDKGYCYMPYKYMMHETYSGNDAWIVKAVSDVDYAKGVWEEDGGSYFASEGSIQLESFYVAVDDSDAVEQFATDLENLCIEYASTEDDYYFDYEETEENGQTYIEITNFDLTVEDTDTFLSDLETLCQEYAEDAYDFQIIGAEGNESEVEDEEVVEEIAEEEIAEEAETETYMISLSDFWCYTDNFEKFSEALEKLCVKFALNGEEYGYEINELTDDDDFPYAEMTDFEMEVEDYDGFMEALTKLCEKHAEGEENYNWVENE